MRSNTLLTAKELFLFLMFFVGTPATHAQSQDVWRILDPALNSELTFHQFYFEDTLRGYAHTTSFTNATVTAITTDGGATWSRGDGGPIPRSMWGNTVVGQNGTISFDGGKTWKEITPTNADTLLQTALPYGSRSASARHFAVMVLGTQQFSDPFGVVGGERLTWTTDGGVQWHTADSAALVDGVNYNLVPRSGFGPYPDTIDTRWNFIVGYADTTTLLTVRSTTGSPTPQYYLGVINTQNGTAEWHTLPFWKKIPPSFADVTATMYALSPTVFLALDQDSLNPYWKSTDRGATWAPTSTPRNLDLRSLRALNDSTWLANNAVTYDAGETWRAIVDTGLINNSIWHYGRSEFLKSQATYVVDTNVILVGRESLIARSTDGGKTWMRNAPALPLKSMIARDNLIVEARGRHMIRISRDSGETWVDRGISTVSGELPERLSIVSGLAWYDTANAPNRILGTATFVLETGQPYMAAIESVDGGITWKELGTIDTIPPFTSISLQSVPQSDGSGRTLFVGSNREFFRSDDEGQSWTETYTWPEMGVQNILMNDDKNGVAALLTPAGSWIDVTTDGGYTWDRRETPTIYTTGAPDGPIVRPEGNTLFLPSATNNDYARFMLFSTDMGRTWDSYDVDALLQGSVMTSWIWLDETELFVCAVHGFNNTYSPKLYYSNDGARTLKLVQEFPTFKDVNAASSPTMVAHDSKYLYFDMPRDGFGRRLITADSALSIAYTESPTSLNGITDLFSEGNTLRFQYLLNGSGTVHAELFDIPGRKIAEELLQSTDNNSNIGQIEYGDIPTGMYLLRLSRGTGESVTAKIVLEKNE